MRASWKGYFRIGEVTVPVRLYAATRSMAPHFVQLDAKNHAPVRRVTINAEDDRELADGDIVRAAEYDGTFVELSEKEIELHSGFERDIVIRQITDADKIDPIYYNMPFYASDYRNQQVDLLNELIERKAKGLPLKKRTYTASSATPEDEVIEKMKKMLGDDPRALHP